MFKAQIDFSLSAPAASCLTSSGFFDVDPAVPFAPTEITVKTPAPDNSKSVNRTVKLNTDGRGTFYAVSTQSNGLSATFKLSGTTVNYTLQLRQASDGTLNSLLMDNYTNTTFPKFGYDNKPHRATKPKSVDLPIVITVKNGGQPLTVLDALLNTTYTCTPFVVAKAVGSV